MKGLFISFEGGEGSGKSSVINVVKERLEADGYKVVITREPGGVNVSEQIRNVILAVDNQMSKETEALLYAASRVEHLYAKVLPLLAEGYIVLSDRYLDSSLAYQGYARGIGIEKVLEINMFAKEYLPKVTYFFDVRPEVGLARIQGRDKIDRLDLEEFDFHQKVYDGYLEVCKMYPERIKSINGEREISLIIDDIYNDIKTYL
jgi:dTMP kinase